jgi:hypothetical protein
MIAIRMCGGLGNLMFQIAAGETWRKRDWDVRYTGMDENLEYIANNYVPKRNAEEYKSLFPNFDWDKYKATPEMRFEQRTVDFHINGINPKEGIEFWAYFQSEKNFTDKAFIRHLFEPNESIKQMLKSYDTLFNGITCSIHVRRGDYLQLSHYHNNLTMAYYNKAMWTMKPFGITKYLVFSDDIPWCMETFKGDQFRFIHENEYMSLFLMGRCKHNIIANSSLSWWGAWLPLQNNRVVIGPEKWFSDTYQNSRDVIPQSWIKV